MARSNTPYRNVILKQSLTADSSDKTFTVPASRQWVVLSIYVKLVSTADVGNRQVDILFTDASDNPISKCVAGTVQAASLTRTYVFAPTNPQETSFTNALMYRALQNDLTLLSGYKIRVYDSAAIAATADDMDVNILVEEQIE